MDTKIRVSPEYFLLLLLTYTIFAEKIKYMRIDIITVLPEMIEGFFNCSIMKRAQNKGLAEIHIHNLRDYTEDKYRRVDDYPFGGFAGMVMKIEPIERCINAMMRSFSRLRMVNSLTSLWLIRCLSLKIL